MASTSSGRSLLKAFLRKNSMTQLALARALKVSHPTVHDWLSGAKNPKYKHRAQIAALTSGAVPVESWESAATLREIRATAPLQPAAPTVQP